MGHSKQKKATFRFLSHSQALEVKAFSRCSQGGGWWAEKGNQGTPPKKGNSPERTPTLRKSNHQDINEQKHHPSPHHGSPSGDIIPRVFSLCCRWMSKGFFEGLGGLKVPNTPLLVCRHPPLNKPQRNLKGQPAPSTKVQPNSLP